MDAVLTWTKEIFGEPWVHILSTALVFGVGGYLIARYLHKDRYTERAEEATKLANVVKQTREEREQQLEAALSDREIFRKQKEQVEDWYNLLSQSTQELVRNQEQFEKSASVATANVNHATTLALAFYVLLLYSLRLRKTERYYDAVRGMFLEFERENLDVEIEGHAQTFNDCGKQDLDRIRTLVQRLITDPCQPLDESAVRETTVRSLGLFNKIADIQEFHDLVLDLSRRRADDLVSTRQADDEVQ